MLQLRTCPKGCPYSQVEQQCPVTNNLSWALWPCSRNARTFAEHNPLQIGITHACDPELPHIQRNIKQQLRHVLAA